MNRPPHVDPLYESELAAIATHLLKMGVRAESMVRDAVRSLVERDPGLARQVVASDAELDRLEVESDAMCVRVMAVRSPVGSDLRLITAALKCVTDLERIGDLAVNIAKRGLELNAEAGIEIIPEVAMLAQRVIDEFSTCIRALRDRDAVVARELARDDQEVDELNRKAFERLIRVAKEYPDQFERALAITSICKNLERVGDHSVNIGESIVYLVEGKMVKHGAA